MTTAVVVVLVLGQVVEMVDVKTVVVKKEDIRRGGGGGGGDG
jgi:hypothetical protein